MRRKSRSLFVFDGVKRVPQNVTHVIVQEGVHKIPEKAFLKRRSLLSIQIPDTVTCIEPLAFWSCKKLETVQLPSSIEVIGFNAFDGCSSLTSIRLPSSITRIGSGAFQRCTSLTSIQVPSSINTIHPYTFKMCESLTLISLPSSIHEIGKSAFEGCYNLESVQQQTHHHMKTETKHDSSKLVPKHSRLEKEQLWNENYSQNFKDTNNNNNNNNNNHHQDISSNFSSFTKICFGAFRGCESLISIDLPSSMEYLGEGAFAGCNSLRSITLPSTIDSFFFFEKNIFPHPLHKVFYDCRSIENVMIPSSIQTINTKVVDLLHIILIQKPQLAKVPCTADSCLPLHFLTMYGLFGSINKLVDTAPFTLTICDPVFDLFPFLLAACTPLVKEPMSSSNYDDCQHVQTIYILLREAPWVMDILMSKFNASSRSWLISSKFIYHRCLERNNNVKWSI